MGVAAMLARAIGLLTRRVVGEAVETAVEMAAERSAPPRTKPRIEILSDQARAAIERAMVNHADRLDWLQLPPAAIRTGRVTGLTLDTAEIDRDTHASRMTGTINIHFGGLAAKGEAGAVHRLRFRLRLCADGSAQEVFMAPLAAS